MKFTKAVTLKQNWLLKKLPNSDLFEVREEFIYYLDYSTKKEYVVIPRWFRTNFGSIPRLLRFFFNPVQYISYLLHDYWYSKNAFICVWDFRARDFTRKEADMILLEALNVEWAWTIEKFCIYIWVRIFGWLNFKK